MDAQIRPFRFFGSERSYFSGKARPAFRAKRLYFEEILPTKQASAEIRRRTGLFFLPTVVTPEDDAWQDTSDIIDTQAEAEVEPPRAVGFHQTRLRDVEFMRYTSSYSLWMVQRPLDAYRALDVGGRAAVDRAVAGTGCEQILAYAPRHRLDKRRFKLVCRRVPRSAGTSPA